MKRETIFLHRYIVINVSKYIQEILVVGHLWY